MQITELKVDGYERVVSFTDIGFQCYIALHNLNLGPALGGCRIKGYPTDAAAKLDVLRLSKGMTYKSSLAGLNLGGGKCVVAAPYATREIMLRVGEAVNYLNGDYITAEDMGTTLADIDIVSEVTPHAIHRDGSSLTGKGVMVSMEAALNFLGHNIDGVCDLPIWVQGLGKVGFDLVERIATKGSADLVFVNDLRSAVVNKAIALGAHEIQERDKRLIMIYAPCAMGQVVNPDNFMNIRYPIICGAANNQLVNDEYAEILKTNGVLYCPDWLVNAGGVIAAACEVGQEYDHTKAETMTDFIGVRMTEVLSTARSENKTPLAVAKEIAESRFMGYATSK